MLSATSYLSGQTGCTPEHAVFGICSETEQTACRKSIVKRHDRVIVGLALTKPRERPGSHLSANQANCPVEIVATNFTGLQFGAFQYIQFK